MLHPKIQEEIMKPGSADRYGSVYTQITRELAKWINDPSRFKLSELIVPYDESFSGRNLRGQGGSDGYDYHPNAETENREEDARKLWTQANTQPTSSEAANTLINLVNGVLERQQNKDFSSDLAVTKTQIRIKDGACFDVLNYYLGAANNVDLNPNYLSKFVAENNVKLLKKTMGSHTFLSTDPIVFNGVKLPKGALFTKTDDGWALLRLTPFSFDQANDQKAFGTEIDKAYLIQKDTVNFVGGIAIDVLAQRAS